MEDSSLFSSYCYYFLDLNKVNEILKTSYLICSETDKIVKLTQQPNINLDIIGWKVLDVISNNTICSTNFLLNIETIPDSWPIDFKLKLFKSDNNILIFINPDCPNVIISNESCRSDIINSIKYLINSINTCITPTVLKNSIPSPWKTIDVINDNSDLSTLFDKYTYFSTSNKLDNLDYDDDDNTAIKGTITTTTSSISNYNNGIISNINSNSCGSLLDIISKNDSLNPY